MQRFLSAVVLVSLGALSPAPAAAQTPAPTKSAAAPPTIAKPTLASPNASQTRPLAKPETVLSDEAELARIVGLYEAGKYNECSGEIEQLLDPTGKRVLLQPASVENARVYWAACLLGAGAADAADAPLRAAIHENPQMKPPDSLIFPQPVVERFLRVRDSLVNEIRAAEQRRIKQAQQEARLRQETLARERERIRQLEALARQQLVIVQNRRVLSFVPFGVGQIQNRQETLGYGLMASEVLLGGLSLTAIVIQSKLATESRQPGVVVDNGPLLSIWGVVKRASFWGFAALAVGGVVQAQVAYVPEFQELRTRKLPDVPKGAPSPRTDGIAWVPYLDAKGGGLDLVGRF